jgi:hypothetical protein
LLYSSVRKRTFSKRPQQLPEENNRYYPAHFRITTP